MRDLLYWTEAVVTFFFLILTLSRSLTYHHKKISRPICFLYVLRFFRLILKAELNTFCFIFCFVFLCFFVLCLFRIIRSIFQIFSLGNTGCA